MRYHCYDCHCLGLGIWDIGLDGPGVYLRIGYIYTVAVELGGCAEGYPGLSDQRRDLLQTKHSTHMITQVAIHGDGSNGLPPQTKTIQKITTNLRYHFR